LVTALYPLITALPRYIFGGLLKMRWVIQGLRVVARLKDFGVGLKAVIANTCVRVL
jgi:hypothetical protein